MQEKETEPETVGPLSTCAGRLLSSSATGCVTYWNWERSRRVNQSTRAEAQMLRQVKRLLPLLALATFASSNSAADEGGGQRSTPCEIEGIRIRSDAESVQVSIKGSRPLAYTTRAQERPPQLCVLFPQARLRGDASQEFPVDSPLLASVVASQQEQPSPACQLTFHLGKGVRCLLSHKDTDKRELVVEVRRYAARMQGAKKKQVGPSKEGKPSITTKPMEKRKEEPVSRGGRQLLTLDFINADFLDVAKALSVQSGVDVAVSAKASGTVTVHLTDKTLEEALELITRLNGLDFKQVKGTWVIATPEELRAFGEAIVTEIVTLKFASPVNLAAAVSAAYPEVNVRAEEGANAVLVTGEKEKAAKAAAAVRGLDVAPPPTPVKPEVPVVEGYRATCASVTELSALLSKAFADLSVTVEPELKMITMKGSAASVEAAMKLIKSADVAPTAAAAPLEQEETILSLPLNYLDAKTLEDLLSEALKDRKVILKGLTELGRVVLSGPASGVAAMRQVIEEMDRPPRQVMIEAGVSDLSPQLSKEIGVTYDFGSATYTEDRSDKAGVGFGTFKRSGLSIESAIKMVESSTDSKLLAHPRVLTVTGKKAEILIGDEIPFEVTQIVQGAVVRSVEFLRAGVHLEITPRVSADGYITMEIKPSVSSFVGFTPSGFPQKATREAQATIRVKDGETVVIGGLLRDEEIRTLEKVPFVGDLPLLGNLFRFRKLSRRKSDVVIFVTPHLMP